METKELLLEISRIKELMILNENQSDDFLINENNLLLENPSIAKVSYQIAIHADDIFKDVAKGEELLDAMNKLGPKASRLNNAQIKTLADQLAESRKLISNAAKNGRLSSLADEAYKKLIALQSKIPGGLDNTPSIQTKVEQTLNKAYDSLEEGSTLDLVNQVALKETYKVIDDTIIDALDSPGSGFLNDADCIDSFTFNLDKALKTIGANVDQFALFRKWAIKNFKDIHLPEFKKTDVNLPNGQPYKRGHAFTERPSNPATDIANIKSLGYFRFLNGLIKKLKAEFGTYKPKDSLEQNLNRLKAVDPATIMVDGKISKEYETIVRAINYDIEQIAGVEKTIDKLWEEVITELSSQYPELVKDIGKVDIYAGLGITQKAENLDGVIERIKKEPAIDVGTATKLSSLSDVLKKLFTTILELKDWVSKFFKNFVKTVLEAWLEFGKKFKKNWWKMIAREVLWGNIRGPREIGKLFTKSGYGSSRKFFVNLALQYGRLLFYKKVLILIPVTFKLISGMVMESFFGIDVLESEGKTVGQIILEEYWEEFNLGMAENGYDVVDYFSIVDFSVAKVFVDSFYTFLTSSPDMVEQELLRSKEEAFNKYWESLSDVEKRNAVKNIIYVGGFKDFSLLVSCTTIVGGKYGNFNTISFAKENKLSFSDVQKIANSLVAYADVQVNIGLENEQEQTIKTIKKELDNKLLKNYKEKEEAEKMLNNVAGVVKDKQGKLYQVTEDADASIRTFYFNEYKIQPYFVVRKRVPKNIDEKIKWDIFHADEINEVPTPADLNTLKSYNPEGMNKDGTFNNQTDAEKFVIDANNRQKIEIGPKIDLKTLLTKL